MNRFASLSTTAALAGALIGFGSASQAQNVLNMYLVPISPLNANYAPGDAITFRALVDIPSNTLNPIALTLGPAVAYNSSVFDRNGLNATADTSAYPPVPSTKLWNVVSPPAYSQTATGPNGVPLDTFQLSVEHVKQQTLTPGNKVTSIPGGTYTIGTFSFPVLAPIDAAHPTTLYLPTAYGFGGNISASDFISSTDSSGTNHAVLAFPNSGSKFSALTYGATAVPEPSTVLIIAIGTAAIGGMLRRRRTRK